MTEARCPACGAHLELVPTGSNPAQSGSNPGSNPTQNLAQIGSKSGSNPEIEREILDLDLNPSSKSYNKGYNAQFLEFWNTFPLKRGKRKAQSAWLKSVARVAQTLAQIDGSNPGSKRAEAQAVILDGARRYRDDPNRDPAFTKYAEGWLNGDRWEDEPLPRRISGNGRAPDSIYDRLGVKR